MSRAQTLIPFVRFTFGLFKIVLTIDKHDTNFSFWKTNVYETLKIMRSIHVSISSRWTFYLLIGK